MSIKAIQNHKKKSWSRNRKWPTFNQIHSDFFLFHAIYNWYIFVYIKVLSLLLYTIFYLPYVCARIFAVLLEKERKIHNMYTTIHQNRII